MRSFPMLVAFIVGVFLGALAYQRAVPSETPRTTSRMLFQTAVEEAHAAEVIIPEDEQVFTQDWITGVIDRRMPELEEFKSRPSRGLEIGSFEGRSAIWFVQNVLTHPDSTMTCVDVFGERLDDFFDHNVKVSGVSGKIIKLKGYSRDVLRTLEPDSYDFIYVDGCHLATCAIEDMTLSWHLLKIGGVMIIDNYDWTGPPRLDVPTVAVDDFLDIYSPAIEVIAKDSQVSLRKIASGY